MSAEAVVAFFGIRIAIQESDIGQLELRRHPLMQKARSVSLQHYWGNFGGINPEYQLLIGRKLSILGTEGDAEFSIPQGALGELMTEIRRKLASIGFEQEPALLLQVQPSP